MRSCDKRAALYQTRSAAPFRSSERETNRPHWTVNAAIRGGREWAISLLGVERTRTEAVDASANDGTLRQARGRSTAPPVPVLITSLECEKLVTVLTPRGEPRFSFGILMGRNKYPGSLVLRVTGTQALRIAHFTLSPISL